METSKYSKIKSMLKRMFVIIVICTVMIIIGIVIWSYYDHAKYTKSQKEKAQKQAQKRDYYRNQFEALTNEQAEKYDFCWESGIYETPPQVILEGGLPRDEDTLKDACLGAAVYADFLEMQDWYKESCQSTHPHYTLKSPLSACRKQIVIIAKENNWPVDYFGCGYTRGSGIVLVPGRCYSVRTDPPDGVVAIMAPSNRDGYLYLYKQAWAKPLLDCFARSTYTEGKTTPSGRQIPEIWSQRGEPCEFSYDLLEKASLDAKWPMGTGAQKFPKSHYKPELVEPGA